MRSRLIAFVVTIGCAPALADTFVLPHVLESSGKITNTQFTFDTTMFMTYSAATPGPTGGASVDMYLFDQNTGQPMRSATGADVCNPCTFSLDPVHRPTAQHNLDDELSGAGGFPNRMMLGFAVVVVNGDADSVNITSAVVNAKTGPLDLSVFGFEPQPINAAANEGGGGLPSTQLLLPGIEERPGSPSEYGGCTDTLLKAVYTAGLIDAAPALEATISLDLFKEDGTPLRAATGAADDPLTFLLDGGNRVLDVTVEDLLLATGGFTEVPFGGYAVATISGDWRNVTMAGYVIESSTGPNDLLRFQEFHPQTVPEPAAVALLGVVATAAAARGSRRRRA